jgi:hypothetical protein
MTEMTGATAIFAPAAGSEFVRAAVEGHTARGVPETLTAAPTEGVLAILLRAFGERDLPLKLLSR